MYTYFKSIPATNNIIDVVITGHGPRSVSVLPYPFHPNKATIAQWKAIPGIGAKRAASLKIAPRLYNVKEIESILEIELPKWFSRTLRFEED